MEDGKYDIVVDEKLNMTTVKRGEYNGPIKDIEVSYIIRNYNDHYDYEVAVHLLNAPSMREINDETNQILFNELWNWLDWEELLVLCGEVMGIELTPEEAYNIQVASEFGV